MSIHHNNRTVIGFIFAIVFTAVLGVLLTKNTPDATAADLGGFRAGNILSDYTLGNYGSMSREDIQNFLYANVSCNDYDLRKEGDGGYNWEWIDQWDDSTGVHFNYRIHFRYWRNGGWYYTYANYHVQDGHYVCIADERFHGQSAADVIYDIAQTYHINPQVLLVLLQKEQGLITDKLPNSGQYRSATGYGCPDTDVCDSQYYGFKNQLENAAALFRYILDNGSRYKPVGNNYIQYNPNSDCGGSNVYIENRATAAFYQYTPYQPNWAALNAGYGIGDGCSAYGNRNFYLYFSDWFGDPTNNGIPVTGAIREVWDSLGGEKGVLGRPVREAETNPASGITYQEFKGGYIVGNDEYGYHDSHGKIRAIWEKENFEFGKYGFPISNILNNPKSGIYYQKFQNGYIVGRNDTGFYESSGSIRETWKDLDYEFGWLGLPTSEIETNPTSGITFQKYQGGYIVGNDKYGYHDSHGKIRAIWEKENFEFGKYGFPVSNILTNKASGIFWQQFQNGYIVGRNDTGFYESSGPIRDYWASTDYEFGGYGLPTSDIISEGDLTYQHYQNGTIYHSDSRGTWGTIN